MVTRNEALQKMLKTYSDCNPCFKGHPPCRYTKTGKCVHCHRDASKRDKMGLKTKNKLRSMHGLVKKSVHIHLDDLEYVEAMLESLLIDRGIPVEII